MKRAHVGEYRIKESGEHELERVEDDDKEVVVKKAKVRPQSNKASYRNDGRVFHKIKVFNPIELGR